MGEGNVASAAEFPNATLIDGDAARTITYGQSIRGSMMTDTMNIEILENGLIKVTTDRISQANHMTAEAFLRNVQQAAGGTVERKHKQGFLGAVAHTARHAFGLGHQH